MDRETRAAIFFAVFTMLIGFGIAAPYSAHAILGFNSVAAGKLLRVDESQGWTTWSDTLYFTSYSRAGTGWINDFANVKLGVAGYVMPRLGWCSDTAGSNMTLIGLAQYSMTYTTTGAGSQRVWCPDRGEPVSAAGSVGMIWDDANQVATLGTAGAGAVTLTWTAATTGINITNFYDAFALLSIVPIVLGAIVVVGVLSGAMNASDATAVAIVAVVFAVAGVLAVVVVNTLIGSI